MTDGGAIAAAGLDGPPDTCADLPPRDAALHIGSLHRLWRHIGAAFECQQLACCWAICRGADEAEAERLLAAHTPLSLATARRHADAWEAARRNGSLMEATLDRPRDAVRFVSELADGGIDAAEVGGVAAILALPPRRRAARIRDLVAAEGRTRRPEDVELIEELKGEVGRLTRAQIPTQREIAELVTAAEEKAAAAAEAVRAHGVSATARERLLLLGDGALAAVERLLDALRPADGEGP